MNFDLLVKSLRLARISRFLSASNESWKAIPNSANYSFSTYGGLHFLLSVNKGLPKFYRELHQ